MTRHFQAAFLALLMGGLPAAAQSTGTAAATPQRPTFTSDASTTAPGTLELELGLSTSGQLLTLPAAVKFSPGLPGRLQATEFSLGFEGLSSLAGNGGRESSFGDRLTLTVRHPIELGNSVSVALAPRAGFFVRSERGARLGVTGILAVSQGSNAIVVNGTFSAATSPSPENPARKYDLAVDFSTTLGPDSRLAIFAGALWENPRGGDSAVSLGQGLSWRVRPELVLDAGFFELGLAGGPRDFQLQAGLTVNLGRPGRW